jgi:aspartyl protease family protein
VTDKKGPWEKNTDRQVPRIPIGVFLWFGSLLIIGLGVWALCTLLPGQAPLDEIDNLRVFKLVTILVLVSSGLFFARRINFGEVARNISIWTGLAAIILVGYTYRTEFKEVLYRVRGELVPWQAIATKNNELTITASPGGHFFVNGKANGKWIRFLVDTGASYVTLSPQDASRIGIDLQGLQFTQKYNTANGIGLGARYRLNRFSIGPIEFADTKISINKSEMRTSLLGMSFLERLKSFEFRDSKLYLRQ